MAILKIILKLLKILITGNSLELAVENLALRQQLATFKLERKPKIRNRDRLFWVFLSKLWTDWRSLLMFVTPETILKWQRRRFRSYWRRISKRDYLGRPIIDKEIRDQIISMAVLPKNSAGLIQQGFMT